MLNLLKASLTWRLMGVSYFWNIPIINIIKSNKLGLKLKLLKFWTRIITLKCSITFRGLAISI